VNRLLGYLHLSGLARARVRAFAVDHSYPHLTDDFVRDVAARAATNVRKDYLAAAGTNETLFQDQAAVAKKGNGFLRFAFLQVRHEASDPVIVPVEGETLELLGEEPRRPEVDMAAVAEAASRLRSAVTSLVGSGMVTCVHATGPPCYHRRSTCPNLPVVLSVALQIVASWERVWPPVEGLSGLKPVWEPPRRAKYAMLALADPDNVSARPDHVPDVQRKIAQRRWHCAMQLLDTALRNAT